MDEVCGCPLVRNVFEQTGEYCRVSKRKCNKHYNWEKLRRAEVDLERVRVVSGTLCQFICVLMRKSRIMINTRQCNKNDRTYSIIKIPCSLFL